MRSAAACVSMRDSARARNVVLRAARASAASRWVRARTAMAFCFAAVAWLRMTLRVMATPLTTAMPMQVAISEIPIS